MNQNLIDLVAQGYTLFKDYKVGASLDVCTGCCMTKAQEESLISQSVQSIPFELLYDYNTAAKTELPEITEFKHFLPRFLDFTAQYKYLHHSVDIILNRFDYYQDSDWSQEERDFLQAYSEALFVASLNQYPLPDFEYIDSLLVMFSKVPIAMQQLLALWLENTTQSSVLHFRDLMHYGLDSIVPDKLAGNFASKDFELLLISWIKDPKTKAHFANQIEHIILESNSNLEQDDSQQLSTLYDLLQF